MYLASADDSPSVSKAMWFANDLISSWLARRPESRAFLAEPELSNVTRDLAPEVVPLGVSWLVMPFAFVAIGYITYAGTHIVRRTLNLPGWPDTFVIRFPLLVILISLAGFGLAWLYRARALRLLRQKIRELGHPICTHCGYDLRGQTEPRCPECGREFDPALLTAHSTRSAETSNDNPATRRRDTRDVQG